MNLEGPTGTNRKIVVCKDSQAGLSVCFAQKTFARRGSNCRLQFENVVRVE